MLNYVLFCVFGFGFFLRNMFFCFDFSNKYIINEAPRGYHMNGWMDKRSSTKAFNGIIIVLLMPKYARQNEFQTFMDKLKFAPVQGPRKGM